MRNRLYGGVRGRKMKVGGNYFIFLLLDVRLAWCHSKGCKSLTRPNSGKCTAEDKGVRRETESEGSLRQTSGLTYRNLI